ncbi:MAG: tRNA (adenosine(37)-N6)-dimethylallyltransferase MiaA, partial [Paludibacteraceae bacterium]|nr:tRNA (adenosine(37)-N6)-dimethylallyltransferase MiaA [Paludibacteraceae bacterium]
ELDFPAIPSIVLGIDIDRDLRREKISKRLYQRMEEGMIEEVQQLLDKGISPENLIYYGLEYKFVTLFLTKQLSYKEMISNLEIAIHQFAKRQMTWFRGMERRGITIHWIENNVEKALEIINQHDIK